LIARLMARRFTGDWRDTQRAVEWADEIADRLVSLRHHPSVQSR
jgi:hypothetical protein